MPENAPEPRSKDELDPGANTEMFQAFVDRYQAEEESAAPRSNGILVGVGLGVLVIVLVIAFLLLR